MSGLESAVSDIVIAAPEIETRSKSGSSDSDWLCAWCHNRVANEKDRFRFDGREEFAFSNPEGNCFVILTFEHSLGCRPSGIPTLEHTWFAGHAWSYCLCDNCGQHLGWFYDGEHHFVGLIKARLVRALGVRN